MSLSGIRLGPHEIGTPSRMTGVNRRYLLAVAGLIAVAGAVLLALGRTPICTCGYVKAWHGVVLSSETSQHVADWYTFSHVIHGIAFYGLLWLTARQWPVGVRLVLATGIEAGWEVLENTEYVINRYREATISLEYYGDSILNSVSDIFAMLAGFFLAARLPIRLSLVLVLVMELFVAYFIRDNLALNILMLVYPLEAVRQWQMGG